MSSNSGYLSNYGVVDARREKRFSRTVLLIVGCVLLGTFLWFYFRTFNDERAVKDFLGMLAQKNYATAYAKFGCAPECPAYKLDRFLEDFGEKGLLVDASQAKVTLAEPCGNTVWVSVQSPNKKELGLSVDPETRTVTFAPEARCPGVWRLSEFPGRLLSFVKRRLS